MRSKITDSSLSFKKIYTFPIRISLQHIIDIPIYEQYIWNAQNVRNKHPFVLLVLCIKKLFIALKRMGHQSVQWQSSNVAHELRDEQTRRKPTLLLRLSGCQLLRFAQRQFCAGLFQEPPRITRFDPSIDARFFTYLPTPFS